MSLPIALASFREHHLAEAHFPRIGNTGSPVAQNNSSSVFMSRGYSLVGFTCAVKGVYLALLALPLLAVYVQSVTYEAKSIALLVEGISELARLILDAVTKHNIA